MKKLFLIPLFFVAGCGPSPDERHDVGYSDGFAVGYNTACTIRATLVEGDWKDKDYSRGYREGEAAGIAKCHADK